MISIIIKYNLTLSITGGTLEQLGLSRPGSKDYSLWFMYH